MARRRSNPRRRSRRGGLQNSFPTDVLNINTNANFGANSFLEIKPPATYIDRPWRVSSVTLSVTGDGSGTFQYSVYGGNPSAEIFTSAMMPFNHNIKTLRFRMPRYIDWGPFGSTDPFLRMRFNGAAGHYTLSYVLTRKLLAVTSAAHDTSLEPMVE